MGYASDNSTSSCRILDNEDKKIKLSRDTILPKKLDIPHSKMQARGGVFLGWRSGMTTRTEAHQHMLKIHWQKYLTKSSLSHGNEC